MIAYKLKFARKLAVYLTSFAMLFYCSETSLFQLDRINIDLYLDHSNNNKRLIKTILIKLLWLSGKETGYIYISAVSFHQ